MHYKVVVRTEILKVLQNTETQDCVKWGSAVELYSNYTVIYIFVQFVWVNTCYCHTVLKGWFLLDLGGIRLAFWEQIPGIWGADSWNFCRVWGLIL